MYFKLSWVLVFLLANVSAYGRPLYDLQEENNVVLQSDLTDTALRIPDSEVWDSNGSGSGNDEKKSKNNTKNEPLIEAGRAEVEVLEVKDENATTNDARSARDNHVSGSMTEIYQSEKDNKLARDDHVRGPMTEIYQSEKDNKSARDDHVTGSMTEIYQSEKDNKSARDDHVRDAMNDQSENSSIRDDHMVRSLLDFYKYERKVTDPENEAKSLRENEDKRSGGKGDDGETKEASGRSPNFMMPTFQNVQQEIRWKFNKARDSLKEAKQAVALAELIAAEKNQTSKNVEAVKDIISKTEVALVHAGEKIGLDYVHYKRSIPDDEDDE